MIIVVMMSRLSDDSVCWVVQLYNVLDTVVISGEDVVVWCLALWLVCLFRLMWSELLMTSE